MDHFKGRRPPYETPSGVLMPAAVWIVQARANSMGLRLSSQAQGVDQA